MKHRRYILISGFWLVLIAIFCLQELPVISAGDSSWLRCRGTNMYSQATNKDIAALRKYGFRTVRLGATGDENDFRYLVNGDSWSLSQANLDRLVSDVRRFKKQGIQIILTLSHVPGRHWQSGTKDVRIFQNRKYQEEFFAAWKIIAGRLSKEENVIGYDLINEPLLPEEQGKKTEDIDYRSLAQSVRGSTSDINEFYGNCIKAIREVDKLTPIILEVTGTGDFSAIALLEPSKDPGTVYSFHYYDPYQYYRGSAKRGQLEYPGKIPNSGFWNKDRHKSNFEKVEAWRKQNKIEPDRIYVGEFGVWKDAIGARQYLKDITDLLNDYGWSWTYYAFREDAYSHADLELEGHLKERKPTGLFKIILAASH